MTRTVTKKQLREMIRSELDHLLTEAPVNMPGTSANTLVLAVLKELNPLCISDFEADKVIKQLNSIGYDIVKTR